MEQPNKDGEKTKWVPDRRISFSERNLNRWAIYGSRTTKVERILKRETGNGSVVETCQIGAVGYKGKYWGLSSVHGRMMNIVETLFYKQGAPDTNIIRISSLALYNYLSDITTISHPTEMKQRDGNKFRDWIYDTLYVLTQIPLMFSSWEKKDGQKGVYRLNLLKGFKMWGKHDDAEWGIISIILDPEYAAGLRERNTAPILIEVENAISGDNAFALYRYLRQVLFKTPVFECDILKLHDRLAIGRNRKDNLISDFKAAAKEIEGRDIPNGRILECKIVEENRKWLLRARRGVNKIRQEKKLSSKLEQARAEEQRIRDAQIEDEAYLKHHQQLIGSDREWCDQRIQSLLNERKITVASLGYELHLRLITIEVLEEFFNHKNNSVLGGYCTAPTSLIVAKEAPEPGTEYGPDPIVKQNSLQNLITALHRVHYAKVNHNITYQKKTWKI